ITGDITMRGARIAVLVLLVAACSGADRTYVDSTGGGRGAAELRADGAACEMALRQSPVGQSVDSGPSVGIMLSNIGDRKIEQSEFLASCMVSRGWERN